MRHHLIHPTQLGSVSFLLCRLLVITTTSEQIRGTGRRLRLHRIVFVEEELRLRRVSEKQFAGACGSRRTTYSVLAVDEEPLMSFLLLIH